MEALMQDLFSWLPLFLLVCLLLLMKNKRYTSTEKKLNLPPTPSKLPIIGNLHQFGSLPQCSMFHLSRKHGPVFLLHLGWLPTVVISSAEAAQELLKDNDISSCSRPRMEGPGRLSYNNMDIANSPYGDYWRDIRKLCVIEIFSVSRVQSYRVIREEEVSSLIGYLSNLTSSGTPVDLTEKFFSLTASLTYRMAFGKRFVGSGIHYEKLYRLLHAANAVLGSFMASEFFPYVGWIFDQITGTHQRLERLFHEMDAIWQEMIDEHLNPERKKPERADLVDVLLGIEKEQAQLGVAWPTRAGIKAILFDIFVGGIDTSAVILAWVMSELARNPRVMKKAQEEVRNLVAKRGRVTESDTQQLPYIKMIIKETLRLYPPAPLLPARETISHFQLQGYDILPKTIVHVNVWGIGRDPKYWNNPEEFFPERFEDKSIDFKGQDFEFLPFGGGRRICPGIYLAMTTIEIVLATVLSCFDWKLPDGMKPEDLNMEYMDGLGTFLTRKEPLKLVPVNPPSILKT